MRLRSLGLFILLTVLHIPAPAQPAKPQPKPVVTATGVFTGRSGKPMARARVSMAQVMPDRDIPYARVKLPPNLPSTTCDAQGKFSFRGFKPGEYTILYELAGTSVVFPTDMGIKSFMESVRSLAPLLQGQEFGASSSLSPRPWGDQYTLLKGHTFYLLGPNMKLWNATVRRGQQGPYMEIRKGVIWLQKLDDKSEIKFDAWSF